MRRSEGKYNLGKRGPRPSVDALPVECWCRCEIVHVEPHVIRATQTASCGRDWCHAPAES